MPRRHRPALLGALSLALIGGAAGLVVASAATPAAVTVGVGGAAPASAAYQGKAVVGNDDPLGPPSPVCTPTGCDQEAVTLKAPAGFADKNNISLSMKLTFDDAGSGNTLDMALLDSSGADVGDKIEVGTNTVLTVNNLSPGSYTIEVDGDIATTPQAYAVSVTASSVTKASEAPLPVYKTGGLTFSRETVASPFYLGSEPNVAADPDGQTVYESPIFGSTTNTSFLLRSSDGGQTFNALSALVPATGLGKEDECEGGGDSDLATDAFSGDIYMIDLGTVEVPTRVSHDRGATFASSCDANLENPGSGAGQLGINYLPDRQWLSTDLVHKVVWYIYRDGLLAPPSPGTVGGIDVSKQLYGEYLRYAPLAGGAGQAGASQLDFASLCTTQTLVATPCIDDVAIAGNAISDNYSTGPGRGNTYLAMQRADNSVGIAVINPTAAQHVVEHSVPGSDKLTPELFPTVAVDHAGNVYLSWVDDTKYQVHLAVSHDQGKTWGPTMTVNGAPAKTTIMPWIVAGDAGRIDIVYYGTANPKNPTSNYGPWNAYMIQSLDAASTKPHFAQQVMTDRPNHIDPICLSGLGCTTDTSPAGDRELGDFFKVTIDATGRALVSFNDGDNQLGTHDATGPGPSPSFAHFVRQASGPSLYASVGDVRTVARPTNGVAVGAHAVPVPLVDQVSHGPGPDTQALGLRSSSTSIGSDGSVTTKVTLAKSDLAAAAAPPGLPLDTVADVLVRWTYRDKIYYLQAQDVAGTLTFASGEPGTLNDVLANKFVNYPMSGTASGSWDAKTSTLTMKAPGSAVGAPKPGSTLYSVTAYTYVHPLADNPASGRLTDLPVIADSLPAYNVEPAGTPSTVKHPHRPHPTKHPVVHQPGGSLAATGIDPTSLWAALGLVLASLGFAAAARRARRDRS
ncbi:MAG TPA: hypothetical protein VHE83_14845 [Mycobacteriales bacterium]|nr:hypothetical protein [Mycobacteriales bacterium]